ncbi:hypothetical protein [Anaerobaca lacustris]|uniref:DUF1109 domain-containing protein n=1 Tax=Anaerobaca lacustris TaxID=3044600 RepID=A0AAW6U026_9BACT|nr:hypothetical protein [Sedimentisphaerales bacterium M17dextr]
MPSNERQSVRLSREETEYSAPVRRRHRLIAWIALAAYSTFLVCRALLRHRAGDAAYVPVWELQDSHRFTAWIGGLAFAGFCAFACFVPVGLLASLAVPCHRRGWRGFAARLAALAIAGAVAVLVLTIENGSLWRPTTAARLVLPGLGCLFGAWVGTTWLRGRRARLWLAPKIAVLVLAAALLAALVLWLSVESAPLPFEAAHVTSAEKRDLVRLIRSKNPRSLGDGQTHTLRLTEHDVNVLLSWGLSLGSPDRKAQVDFAPDAASLAVSIGVAPGNTRRYLNFQLTGTVRIDNGDLMVRVDRCRLGRMPVPSWLIDPWCPVVASLLRHDRRSKPFLDAIRTAQTGPDWIEATYARVDLPPGFREDLFGPAGAGEEVLASTRAQVEQLLAAVEKLPRGRRPTFGMCLETAFALARERSIETNAVTENRAAIFALGVLLGHSRIEEFLGPVLPEPPHAAARRALWQVQVRERADWTKHFFVSAAIALLSDTVISDAAGLLKEEFDADTGGSGFSFADLLADRAGTTFAVRATRDEASARAIQDRLAHGFQVDDFFPPADDLPEGISDAKLTSDYGGVGGARYLHLIDEIERRIAACAAYR